MSQDLVTVATFRFVHEAEVSRLRLEAEGLTPFLADAQTVTMDWFLGNAVGEIKLQVPSDQAKAAGAVLEEMRRQRRDRDEHAEELESDSCLACGAKLRENESRCAACGWSYADDDGSGLDE